MNKAHPTSRALLVSVLGIALFTLLYIYVYQVQPFPSHWNDTFINYSIFTAAALSAILTTHIWLRFDKDEAPRPIWLYFALGLWAWALAEGVFSVWFNLYGDVPDLSYSDVLWIGAYLFFGLSFVHQFRLIYATTRRQETVGFGLVLLGVGVASVVTTVLMRQSSLDSEQTWLETFVGVLYPFADLALALAAIKMARVFGRGLWGQAWLGLLMFVLADATYTWLYFSGLYAISVENGNPLSLLADTLYLDAYLLMSLACLGQLLLLRFGPPPTQRRAFKEITPSAS